MVRDLRKRYGDPVVSYVYADEEFSLVEYCWDTQQGQIKVFKVNGEYTAVVRSGGVNF